VIAKSRPFARPGKKNSGRIWQGFSIFEHLSLKVYRAVFSFWELRENCEIRKPGRTFFCCQITRSEIRKPGRIFFCSQLCFQWSESWPAAWAGLSWPLAGSTSTHLDFGPIWAPTCHMYDTPTGRKSPNVAREAQGRSEATPRGWSEASAPQPKPGPKAGLRVPAAEGRPAEGRLHALQNLKNS